MSHRHVKLIRSIFHDPPSGNVHWRDVESLLRHVGASLEPISGARVRVKLNRMEGIMNYREAEAHLLLLAVQDSLRRRGIGTALVSWLERTALVAGIGVIYLEARHVNQEARAFYAKLGYQEIQLVRGYYSGVEAAVRLAQGLWAETPSTWGAIP